MAEPGDAAVVACVESAVGESMAPAPEASPAEQPANGAAQELSDDVVRQKLLSLLERSDLATTTEKMLRKQLEEELGVGLSSKKALIRAEVLSYLAAHEKPDEGEEQEEEEAEEEEEEEEPKPGKRRAGGLGSVLSEPMQEFLGVKSMARTQVVKAIWQYIKANDLQDPKNRRNIIVDEKLATLFTPPITMFNMNKQLSKHVFTRDVVGGGSDDEEGGGSSKPARRPAKRAKKSSSDGAGKGSKAGGFAKPLPLSQELAEACGQPEMSRGGFNKWLYAYVDEHNLKDPQDKRYALCNETLEKLTGEKRFMLFGSQKLFSRHFLAGH